MKKYLILLAAVVASFQGFAVTPTWSVDLDAVFDNREGDRTYSDTKTFLFTRLAPELGLNFTSSDRIAGGVVWYQPIGCEWDGHRVSPTLYYRHESSETSPWSFSMGMFPRTQLREKMPDFLWCDSLDYTQRNIRGMLVQYSHRRGFFDFYLDWRGMQTEKQREAFNVVFHGRVHPKAGGCFFVGGHAMMNHFALQKNSPADQHIVDNFVVSPYVGVDLSGKTFLDSLSVRGGLLMTIERNRADGEWHAPAGFRMEACAEWKWFGLKEIFYAGGAQMPSYIPFRSQLYQGEPYYQARTYSRTDIYANVLRNKWINLKVSLDFNVAGSTLNFYQRVILSVNVDGSFGRRCSQK